MGDYKVGDRVWVSHLEDAWLGGVVVASTPKVGIDVRTDQRGVLKVPSADVKARVELAGNHMELSVDNLVDLDELSEGAILHHVRKRFLDKSIYTHVGAILVAVNPFQILPIYGPDDVKRAQNAKLTRVFPHVFVTAAGAYEQLMLHSKNQAVLISGESGAGKTETTKKVLNYLASVAPSAMREGDDKSIEDKILRSNPLLEACGNAKTLRNNNSSRFGKWMKVDFDGSFRIQGCEIVNYLLEKSRVVVLSQNERNYHIFYQLVRGVDDSMKRKLFLGSVTDYKYLIQSECCDIAGVDDKEEFKDVMAALKVLQFEDTLVEEMFMLLASILILGNVRFIPRISEGVDACDVDAGSAGILANVAELLGVQKEAMAMCLKMKYVQMGRGSMVAIQLSSAVAAETRDSLCKHLYGNMFDFIVQKINASMRTPNAKFFIGILDIFGFEVFEQNTFEQLCINYANEKLQFHFNDVIFSEEKRLYNEEGIPTEHITFVDNSECVKLIEDKPFGLIVILDEECSLGNGTDAKYISKIDSFFGINKQKANAFFVKHRTKQYFFSVKHFAGPVEYNVISWVEKNRDTLNETIKDTLKTSSRELICKLFTDSGKAAAAGTKAAKITLGSQFRSQLIGLIDKIHSTEPHFIRCIKPNSEKVPMKLDGVLALRQLRYAGLFEAIRIRKSGFAYRSVHSIFANTFQELVDGLAKKRKERTVNDESACAAILEVVFAKNILPPNVAFVGKTRIFVKSNEHRSMLEQCRQDRILVYAIRIQAGIRGFVCRMRVNAAKYERDKEKKRLLAERRAEEERIEAIRKAEEARLAEVRRIEALRLAELRKKQAKAIIIVQKYARRFLVKKCLVSFNDNILLRKFLQVRDAKNSQIIINRMTSEVKKITMRLKNNANFSSKVERDSSAVMVTMLQQEIANATLMVKYIELQDNFVSNVNQAIALDDAMELNKLLIRSKSLNISTHPIVKVAVKALEALNKKRKVIAQMVAFCSNQESDDSLEHIFQTISDAVDLNIDPEFIRKVQNIYDNQGPRLRVRSRLRKAIEFVHEQTIEGALEEAERLRLQSANSDFCEIEVRAAKEMLRLLRLDRILEPKLPEEIKSLADFYKANPCSYSESTRTNSSSRQRTLSISSADDEGMKNYSIYDGNAMGARLDPIIMTCCDNISMCTAQNFTGNFIHDGDLKEAKMSAISELKRIVRNSDVMMYMVIRSFKWSKTYSIWKYPEVLARNRHDTILAAGIDVDETFAMRDDSGDVFFGLRPAEARGCIHVIRSVHSEVDPTVGNAPASILAAMGLPNMHLLNSNANKLSGGRDLMKADWKTHDINARNRNNISINSNPVTPNKATTGRSSNVGVSPKSADRYKNSPFKSITARYTTLDDLPTKKNGGVSSDLKKKLEESRKNVSYQRGLLAEDSKKREKDSKGISQFKLNSLVSKPLGKGNI